MVTILGTAGLVLAIVALNFFARRSYRKITAKMTPEEKKQYDKETDEWLQSFSM